MCMLSTCLQLHDEEDEFIDIESDDVDNVLNIFEEITAELLKEGEVLICMKANSFGVK